MRTQNTNNKISIAILVLLNILLLTVIVSVLYLFILEDDENEITDSGKVAEANTDTSSVNELDEEVPDEEEAERVTADEDSMQEPMIVINYSTSILKENKDSSADYTGLGFAEGDRVIVTSQKEKQIYYIKNDLDYELLKERYRESHNFSDKSTEEIDADYDSAFNAVSEGDVLFISAYDLVPESEYERYEQLLSEIFECYDLEETEYLETQKLYYDFDNDGLGELYVAYGDLLQPAIYYSDDNYVHKFEDDEFYGTRNGDGSSGQYWSIVCRGDKCVAMYTEYSTCQYYWIFNVENNEPKVIKLESLNNEYDWTGYEKDNGRIKVYNSFGEAFYTYYGGAENVVYPVWYINGEESECASCVVDPVQFGLLEGSHKLLESADNEVRSLNTFFLPRIGDFSFRVCDTEIASIYYNDVVGFIVNYNLDVEFGVCEEESDIPYAYVKRPNSKDIHPLDGFFGERLDLSRSKDGPYDCDEVDTDVDKLTAHVYAKYENGKFTIYNVGMGEVELSSGDFDTVVESDFNSFMQK